ncbi:MAG: hypothetical protein UR28_C0021G0017 [Candidatus Peregrinibacteria bacterium GW2011_GWF2_33_10]|nr:MAG: hypothetical protein UR28_C0021G0017 [Candidatus Peregrinibacteria bacterium GW2011_GWF2_33_10]OGJ44372.1 MAG: hypothetical protein A2263_05790 [Candidatus Peregrinibacteria bacterium RIFOXYA2_FULL_33_21]OGJ46393.1 MAG: hypothetical protein A2272_01670 [Candidatus Peregrinibacteria bacterium RIFOXYA12_FULL_33_12]OGJ50167.1 MAG: hypothetical protein A2307_03280 [Candidatus Peregrinibacteria bacterium RIFOXYB2_FULL_33_20]
MNYPDLKLVIKEVCGQTACPSCSNKYQENDIHIVGTTKNEGVLMARCQKCHSNVVINVSVTRKSGNDIKAHERDWKPIFTKVTADEVLDVHNFLNTYNGDLTNLFK